MIQRDLRGNRFRSLGAASPGSVLVESTLVRLVMIRPIMSKPVLPQAALLLQRLRASRGRSLVTLGRLTFSIRILMFAACILIAAPSGIAAGTDNLLTSLPETPVAPDFELRGLDDEIYRLADFEGKPLIVNFWATWCPPCRAEMPSMQRAWEQVEAEGIGMIAINVGEDAETVQAFLQQVPVSFPLPLDTDSKVTQSWPMRGLPTTFVVSPDGRLVFKATGEREWDDPALLDQVRALKHQ